MDYLSFYYEQMTNFVLISTQGSGTNLLRSLLNSHPDFFCADELFSDHRHFGRYQNKPKPAEVLLKTFYNGAVKAKGFTLMYNQMSQEIVNYINENKIKVVHLMRDPVRAAFSHGGFNDKYWENYKSSVEKVRALDTEIFEIRYEEITRGKEIREDKVVDWLDPLAVFLVGCPSVFYVSDKEVHRPLTQRYYI